MLKLTMLPASYGDALWLEYGKPGKTKIVVIDCGFKTNYRELAKRIKGLETGQLELLVLTHVDEDHIKGAIPLLADKRLQPSETFDVWFNGWKHLLEGAADDLGSAQGEYFSALINDREFRWNQHSAFGGGPIVVRTDKPLPSGELAGGLRWTLLSPTPEKLTAMRDLWREEIAKIDLDPGDHDGFLELFREQKALQPSDDLGDDEIDIDDLIAGTFEEDDRAPNGSSIALLVEYEGRSVLLLGDAHPSVVTESLERLQGERGGGKISIDAMKVSHHGSRKNTSPELLEKINCRTFLFSSSGAKFGHPSPECVARIIAHRPDGVELRFNYASDVSLAWKEPAIKKNRKYQFDLLYPEDRARELEL